MTYSKGQQISPKTSHIWYNREQYHPPFGFIDTASGSSNTKKGECTESYFGHINQATKTLSHSSWVTMAFGKNILLFTGKYKLFMAVLIKFRK